MKHIALLISFFTLIGTVDAQAQSVLYGRRSLGCGLNEGDFDAIDAASPCSNYRALVPQQITFQVAGGAPQTLDVNFGGGDTVYSYTNLGAFGDMVQLNIDEMNCRQRLMEDSRKPENIERLTDAALARFQQLRRSVRPRVAEIRERRDSLTALSRSGGGDRMDRSAAAMGNYMLNERPAEQAIEEVTRAFSGVPFGVEVNVLQKLRDMNDRFPPEMDAAAIAEFRREYQMALYETSNMYFEGATKLIQENIRDRYTVTPDGRRLKAGAYVEWNQDLWNSMMNFGSHEDYISYLQSTPRPISREVAGRLQCHMERQRPENVGSIISMGTIPAAFVPGGLAVDALAAAYFTTVAINDCFVEEGNLLVRGRSCQENHTVDTAISRAFASSCSEAALNAVGSVGGTALAIRGAAVVDDVARLIPRASGVERTSVLGRFRSLLRRAPANQQDEAVDMIAAARRAGKSDDEIQRAMETCPIPGR